MSSLQPPTDITKHKRYAIAILLATILATIAQVLVVPPAWLTLWETKSANKEPIPQNQAPAEPMPSATPPGASPPAEPAMTLQGVCGVWLSETSGKKYNFVCQDKNTFVIYEIKEQLLTNAGSGKITGDGSVEADILVSEKNRKAHLRLRLSSDGQKIEGSWHGDDPREAGRIVFHKIVEGYPA